MDNRDEKNIQSFADETQIPIMGKVPYDPQIRNADVSGKPLIFPSTSSAIIEIETMCNRLIELKNKIS